MTDLSPGTAVFETDFPGEARFMASQLGPEFTVTAGVDTLYAVRVKQPIVEGIVTNYNPKPMELRTRDWEARQQGSDENSPVGYGANEVQAIADLLIELESA